jgi:hypothetical protein
MNKPRKNGRQVLHVVLAAIALGCIPHAGAAEGNWRYSEDADKMRGTVTKFAAVDSQNQLQFDFPYQGGSVGTLMLRKSSRYGSDVILRIDRGQFSCFMDCAVHVKFDNGKVERLGANSAADGSTGVIFLSPYGHIVSRLKQAKRVIIEADYFQHGSQQLEFNVVGLKWQ